jgi:hypothetical protein
MVLFVDERMAFAENYVGCVWHVRGKRKYNSPFKLQDIIDPDRPNDRKSPVYSFWRGLSQLVSLSIVARLPHRCAANNFVGRIHIYMLSHVWLIWAHAYVVEHPVRYWNLDPSQLEKEGG